MELLAEYLKMARKKNEDDPHSGFVITEFIEDNPYYSRLPIPILFFIQEGVSMVAMEDPH
jgi:hypothetical protein